MSFYEKDGFSYKRSERVASLIMEEIAALLQRGMKDPRFARVNITCVKVSDDLRHAKVYFNTIGGERVDLDEINAGFERAAGYIRRTVGKNLNMKILPDFTFHYDDTLDKACRIEKILREALHGDGEEED